MLPIKLAKNPPKVGHFPTYMHMSVAERLICKYCNIQINSWNNLDLGRKVLDLCQPMMDPNTTILIWPSPLVPLCKGFIKPFHSRKFPLVCGGKFPKGKDHCPSLPKWLHLLSFLPTNPIDTLLLGWKASANTLSLCWVITQFTWGAWLVLTIPKHLQKDLQIIQNFPHFFGQTYVNVNVRLL